MKTRNTPKRLSKKRRKSSLTQLSLLDSNSSVEIFSNDMKSKATVPLVNSKSSLSPKQESKTVSKNNLARSGSPSLFEQNENDVDYFMETGSDEGTKHNKLCNSSHEMSILQDSVFDNVDLSLLEKQCFAPQAEEQATVLTQVDSTETSNNIKSKHTEASSPFAEKLFENMSTSTPKNTKVISNLSDRIRQKLQNNAQVSPMIKPIKKHDNQLTHNEEDFYGLPKRVKELLKSSRGIDTLYDWQHKCLSMDGVTSGQNLIYSLPTSGGKTLVAEILIMRTILCKHKNAVLVVPFVAIAQEKVQSIALFAMECDFLVEEYAGSKGRFPPRKRRSKNVLYICTMEKANSLVNSLIDEQRLEEIGLYVVDELHMLGEGGKRGATLESMLTKVIHQNPDSQIVGMSATIGNIDELASFLNAQTFTDDFRPVELSEYVKVDNHIYEVDSNKLRAGEELTHVRTIFSETKETEKADSDQLSTLIKEVVPDHSCLVFCPTKKNCENVAVLICKLLPKTFFTHKEKEKMTLLNEMYLQSDGVICPILQGTIPYGIAYHHSGLTSDERQLIENAYRSGAISVITCTSTLAAGVNLPARRVIIRSPYVGRSFMTCAQYKQMIGRAGRAGIDTKGESFLIFDNRDKEKVKHLLSGHIEMCLSSMMYDNGKGFKALLLNLIGLRVVKSQSDVCDYFQHTLFSKQVSTIKQASPGMLDAIGEKSSNVISSIVDNSLKELLELNLVSQTDDGALDISTIGCAVHKGSVDINISELLFHDLEHGLHGLVLENYFHLLYLVTPYEAAHSVDPNWLMYLNEMNNFSPGDVKAASAVGISEHYIALKASGRNLRKTKVNELVFRRFYVTIMLYQLYKGRSIWDVASQFNQPRGFLQNLLSSTVAFASSTLHFTEEVEKFWPYTALFERVMKSLQFSTSPELTMLMEIPGVKLARAKQLHKLGYHNLHKLATASPDILVRDIQYMSFKQAQQIIAAATVQRNEKINTLEEEIQDLQSATK
uniref:Helicase POLQ-like n=1 Tax=Phallusia mammillata TaxID=59560 RepID=A0A6F9DF30_9ASCI|nr:helicase POLQ-like [Phallusia mammillata]